MANKRIDMRKVRELLRLKFQQGLSIRKAAKAIGIGNGSGRIFQKLKKPSISA